MFGADTLVMPSFVARSQRAQGFGGDAGGKLNSDPPRPGELPGW